MSTLLPTYLCIEEELNTLNIPITCAEAHGLMTGIIAATNDEQLAFHTLFRTSDDMPADDIVVDDAKKALRDLAKTTKEQLNDTEMSFALLLPEDTTELSQLGQTLGLWCQGFISGLGDGQIKTRLESHEELQELLHDLTEIAQIDSDSIDQDKQDEVDLIEIIEFVRVAVLTAHADLVLQETKKTTENNVH